MPSGIKLPFHPIPSICECPDITCNEITCNGRKYKQGHNNRGKEIKHSEEATRNQALSNTKTFLLKPDGSKEIYPKIPVICNCMRPSCYEICWNGNYIRGHSSINSNHPSYGMLGKKASKETRKNMSDRQKEYILKNPESIKKRLSFNSPNKSELKLFSIINNIYPNEWKFVGDGSFIIDGKCPDYINC